MKTPNYTVETVREKALVPLTRYKKIVIFGPPSCGKGTFIKKLIAKHPQLGTFSMSEHLNSFVASPPAHMQKEADAVQDAMSKGNYVEDHIVLEIFKERTKYFRQPTIFDGVPRTQDQAFDFIAGSSKEDIVVIFINASFETCRTRSLKRGRDDDKIIEHRYHNIYKPTEDVIDFFNDADIPVLPLDGNREMDDLIPSAEMFLKLHKVL